MAYPRNGGNAAISWPEALEIVVARTKHARYRHLCSEHNTDPESREGYRRLVITLATGIAPDPEPPTPEDLALREFVQRHGCGCG